VLEKILILLDIKQGGRSDSHRVKCSTHLVTYRLDEFRSGLVEIDQGVVGDLGCLVVTRVHLGDGRALQVELDKLFET
jgi:hypothetical protein